MKKSLFIILLSLFFIGCEKEEKKDFNKTISLTKDKIDFLFYVEDNKPKFRRNRRLESIYYWEYMYLFLFNAYIYKTEKDEIAFSNFVKKLKLQKINDLKVLEKIFEEHNILYERPEMNTNGEYDFKNIRINKAFEIFKKPKKKKNMYKYLCIGFNSIIYKLSDAEKKEKHLFNKYLIKGMEEGNINKLILIDDTLRKININGCCEVSGILCPIKKANKAKE